MVSGRFPPRALRLQGLGVAALVATEAVRRLVAPPLTALARAAGTEGRTWDQLPFGTALAGCCAAALSLAWAWLLLCGTLVAVDALRRGDVVAIRAASPAWGCPRWVRALVLAALGLVVSAVPVLADAPGAAPVPAADLAGLAVPDRVLSPATTPRRHLELVRPGDTLWAIAARQLPPTASDGAVDRAWRRLAAANHDLVADPDLIFPGTVLRLPDLDRPTRKEAP